jgi:conjugal transfer/type IV secretion protein DotA/TraY
MQFKDYFTAAVDDPSRAMLDLLADGGGPAAEILSIINMTVFAIAVFFIIYSVIGGLIRTAQTGEFLGKTEKSWMALRMTFGLAGLMPVFGGLAIAQIVVLFCGIIGVGVGNLAWEAGYKSLLAQLPDSPFSAPAPASQLDGARAVLAALVCQEEVNRAQQTDAAYLGTDPGTPVSMQIIDSRTLWPDFDGIALIFGGPEGHPADLCGGVRVPVAMEAESEHFSRLAVEKAHSRAMVEMSVTLQPVAQALAADLVAPARADLEKAAEAYEKAVAVALASAVSDTNSSFSGWMDTGQGGKSWIYAGSMLSKVAAISREIQAAAGIKAEAVPSAEGIDEMGGLRAVAQRAQLASAGADAQEKTAFSLKKPDLGVLIEPIRSQLFEKVVGWLAEDDHDLLGGLSRLGHIIMIGTLTAAAIVLAILAKVSLASVGTLGGLAGGAFSVFVYLFCLPLLAAGLMFAYFLPFLPLIYWITGVLGWLTIFILALFCSPLWMLALVTADGEGVGRAEAGFLHMLDLILRPALMVAGLLAGWMILLFFGGFLKLSLSVFFGSGGAFSGASGLLGFVATLFLFAYLAWQVVGKAFSLIQEVPAAAMSWIGGSGRGGDGAEKEMESKAAGVVAGVGAGRGGRGSGKPGGGGIAPPSGLNGALAGLRKKNGGPQGGGGPLGLTR